MGRATIKTPHIVLYELILPASATINVYPIQPKKVI